MNKIHKLGISPDVAHKKREILWDNNFIILAFDIYKHLFFGFQIRPSFFKNLKLSLSLSCAEASKSTKNRGMNRK